MQMLVLVWLQFHAAQQCLEQNVPPSRLPDEESHLNSPPTVAQPDEEIAGRQVDAISSDRPPRNEGERAKE